MVDHFHVVKLANDTVAEVRRRTAAGLRGRRGRKNDPEYQVRTCCAATVKTSPARRSRSCGTPRSTSARLGLTILKAWIAKEALRHLLALAGTGVDRSVISHRLYRFYTCCADAGIPELERLATTIQIWWRGARGHFPTEQAALKRLC